MPQELRTRHGLPYSFAANMPFTNPPTQSKNGIYLGSYFDHRPFVLHPYELYNEGNMFATTLLITGQIGYRKSGLKKLLALRGGTLLVGINEDGTKRFLTIRMHGRKHVGDHCENDPTITAIGGYTISLARERTINPFDPFTEMDKSDKIEIAIMFAEDGANRKVTALDSKILQIGIWKMLKLPPVSAITGDVVHTLERFTQLVSDITMDEYDLYAEEIRSTLQNEDKKKFEQDPELLRLLLPSFNYEMSETTKESKRNAISKSVTEMAAALERVLGADYGCTFGGGKPLLSIFGGDAVNWDWLGMTVRARALMERFQWKILQVAYEKGRHDLVPDMNLSDEAQDAMNSPEYAAQRSRALAVTRSFSTFDVEVTQYVRQISKQGDKDSALRAYGETIMQTIAARFMAHIESGDRVGIEECLDMGFTDTNMRMMHHLHPGQFAIKVTGRKEPAFVSIDQTPLEEPLLYTKQAVEKVLNRPYDRTDAFLSANSDGIDVHDLADMAAAITQGR